MFTALALTSCESPTASKPPSSPVTHASTSPSQQASPTPPPTPLPSPSSEPTRVGLYLQILQSEYGFVSATTESGAICSAKATLPNGGEAGGLRNPQIAGSDGTASWRYPQPATTSGTGTHVVSCSKEGRSASQYAYFILGA
jgi:hypothetical protein